MKKAGFIFFLFIAIQQCYSQRVEWLHAIEADVPAASGNTAIDLDIDKNDNSYFLGIFNNQQMGSTATTKRTLVKYNKEGVEYWHKNIDYEIIALSATDDSCNLYSVAYIDKATIIGNDTFGNPVGRSSLILIKSDSSFNIEWARLVSDSVHAIYSPNLAEADIITTKNEVLVSILQNRYFKFKSKQYSDDAWEKTVFLRLEKYKAGSAAEWSNVYKGSGSSYKNVVLTNLQVDGKGYTYSMLRTTVYKDVYINDTIRHLPCNSVILKISVADGVCRDIISLDTTNISEIYSFAVLPSGKIFVTGGFKLKFDYKTVSFTSSVTDMNGFLLLLDDKGNAIWALKEENTTGGGRLTLTKSIYKNDRLFTSGTLQNGGSGINGIPLPFSGIQQRVLAKLDTLGNCLWAFPVKGVLAYYYPSGPLYLQAALSNTFNIILNIDTEGNVYMGDNYSNNYSVLDTSIVSNTGKINAVIVKIGGFAIIRGNVYPGPYCAGDTIEIPYTLKGIYDTANVFIAQLSDEDGNFTGGERELGRLKTNKDSVVLGTLPLFNVETSGNYRIRIFSTHPIAQSDYIKDTLRLLVYSRDSANAGPDTVICKGQSVKLKTTGGSKWQWSPATYSVNPPDSANRKMEVRPDITTEYRIIISDSSGCGDTDTDYVKVFVRPPLTLSVNNDTTICYQGMVSLQGMPQGGLPLTYKILWSTDSVGGWTDTNFSVVVYPGGTTTYTAILTDNCTTIPDTQRVKVTVRPPLSLSVNNDDSICSGKPVVLSATASGGDSAHYSLLWSADNKLWTSHLFAVTDTPQVTTVYTATLADNCSPEVSDSVRITVIPSPKASFAVTPDTGCVPLTVHFTDLSQNNDTLKNIWAIQQAEVFSTANYDYRFLMPGKYTIGLTVFNSLGCSDIFSKPAAVTVFQKPVASFTVKPEIKEVEKELLFINNSYQANKYRWEFGNNNTYLAPDNNTVTYMYSDTGTYAVKLLAINEKGCTDTALQTIRVYDRMTCAVPNAFTPNNRDNLNNTFAPVCTGLKSYTLGIYNRWGQLIYEQENSAWDGTYEGQPVPQGLYMFMLQVQAESGRKETITGWVSLLQ